jgi:DNA repair protein RecO
LISTTEAIVLQTRRYSESSKIVALYTREHGKQSVIARGALQAKSKYGAVLQPMAFLSTTFYRKEGRDLHNLSSAETVERFPMLATDLERMTIGLAIVELVSASMHDEDRNEQIFDAIVTALRALGSAESNGTNVLLWFVVRLSGLLGYAIGTSECGVCSEPVTAPVGGDVAYSLALGAPLCAEHRDTGVYRMLPADAFDLLGEISGSSVLDAASLVSDERSRTILLEAVTSFVRHHIDGIRKLKVGSVAASLLGDKPLAGP